MLTPKQAQFAFVPLVVTLMSGVMSLAMTALHHGLRPGLLSAWLHGWPVAFVVALPTAWLVLPGVRALLARATVDAVPARKSVGRLG